MGNLTYDDLIDRGLNEKESMIKEIESLQQQLAELRLKNEKLKRDHNLMLNTLKYYKARDYDGGSAAEALSQLEVKDIE